MVRSKAADVNGYIAEAPPERQPHLRRVREVCLRELAGYEEGITYGMPTYVREGRADFAFASQKQYVSLYVMRPEAAAEHAAELAGLDMGKGCLRYRRPELIDYDLLARLLRSTAG